MSRHTCYRDTLQQSFEVVQKSSRNRHRLPQSRIEHRACRRARVCDDISPGLIGVLHNHRRFTL